MRAFAGGCGHQDSADEARSQRTPLEARLRSGERRSGSTDNDSGAKSWAGYRVSGPIHALVASRLWQLCGRVDQDDRVHARAMRRPSCRYLQSKGPARRLGKLKSGQFSVSHAPAVHTGVTAEIKRSLIASLCAACAQGAG
jgi:hypothetical protein